MILVAGATGFLGRAICARLAAAGRPVRAVTRPSSDPEAVRRLAGMGAEIVLGDLKEIDSLRSACAGVDTVVSTASSTRSRGPRDGIEATDRQGQLDLVRAAREAGARRFLLVSVTGTLDDGSPLVEAKRAVEAAVRGSGMTHTILRPGIFMEVWLGPALGFDFPNARATVYGDGTRPVGWISLEDVAEYAVRALTHPAAEDATLELGGPEALSPREVVGIFEEVGGRPFEVEYIAEEALRARAAAATDPLQRSFAGLMLAYAAGCASPPNRALGDFPLRTVREYAAASLGVALPRPTP